MPDASVDLAPLIDLAMSSGFCAETCRARDGAADAMGGWCFSSQALGFTDCRTYCDATSPRWGDAERRRFSDCAASNPLCFEFIEACMRR